MKYLVLLLVVVGVLWLARSRAGKLSRRGDPAGKPPQPPQPPQPQTMVSCMHCGVHLPRDDAVDGAQGPYCSEAHRLAHGDRR